MTPTGKFEQEALAALQRAVARALERKRRLGQYAVFWENGRVILDGPDAPVEQVRSTHRRRIGARETGDTEATADGDQGGRES